MRTALGAALLIALSFAISCSSDANSSSPPAAQPQLTRQEALQLYVQWVCEDPVQQGKLLSSSEANATFDGGTWRFSYGTGVKATLRESEGVVVPLTAHDAAVRRSFCK